jgi:putative addiction module CopG family antidote
MERLSISMSPKMVRFIRSRVKSGGYTNISEVVRTAVRRMQEEEAREARLARSAVDDILAGLTAAERTAICRNVRSGVRSMERGEYTDYVGREGLARLAAQVKARGRKLLASRTRDA